MGDIIGGLIGGAGSLLAGQSAKSNALTGYNYLAGKNGTPGPGSDYVNTGLDALKASQGTQATENALLTGGPGSPAAKAAFGNYLGSTGYQFAKDQGTSAITGSAAARSILNSGATAKALMGYGQGLAGQSFNNYFGQLGTLNTQQTGTANAGLNAAEAIGQAGTTGGATAAQGMSSGISGATGSIVGSINPIKNYFGGV